MAKWFDSLRRSSRTSKNGQSHHLEAPGTLRQRTLGPAHGGWTQPDAGHDELPGRRSFQKAGAASLFVDRNGKQEERKNELLPPVTRRNNDPLSSDRLLEVQPSFLDKVKKHKNELHAETAGLQENEKMTGYLDYLGAGNADDKTIAVEAATDAPVLSTSKSAQGVIQGAKRQNFVTGSLEDAGETAEDRHRVRFHPVNNELVADSVLPTDGETNRGLNTERDS